MTDTVTNLRPCDIQCGNTVVTGIELFQQASKAFTEQAASFAATPPVDAQVQILQHLALCQACDGTGDAKPDWRIGKPSRNNCPKCGGFGYRLVGNRAKFRALVDEMKHAD